MAERRGESRRDCDDHVAGAGERRRRAIRPTSVRELFVRPREVFRCRRRPCNGRNMLSGRPNRRLAHWSAAAGGSRRQPEQNGEKRGAATNHDGTIGECRSASERHGFGN